MVYAFTDLRLVGPADRPWATAHDLNGYKYDAWSTGHCLAPGSTKYHAIPDGPFGEDNAFGQSVGLLFAPWVNLQKDVTGSYAAGRVGSLLSLDALGGGQDLLGVTGTYLRAEPPTDEMGKPLDPGGKLTSFPWRPSSDGAERGQAKLAGYMNQGVLVLRAARLVVRIPVQASPDAEPSTGAYLVIRDATVTARVAKQGQQLEEGILTGRLHVDDFVWAAKELLRQGGICAASGAGKSWTTLDDMSFRAWADLVLADPEATQTCDAVSVGFGFEAARSALGPDSPVAVPVPQWCDGSSGPIPGSPPG